MRQRRPRGTAQMGDRMQDGKGDAGRWPGFADLGRACAPVLLIPMLLVMALAHAPAAQEAAPDAAGGNAVETAIEGAETPAPASRKEPECKPDVGCVTNLPLPRFVSLKGDEGNARRGPGLTHRIDWVFTRPGMPLRVTAEYENWRRVEDQEGAGGWVHYALLSGVRSVVVTEDMAEMRAAPNTNARVDAQAEVGVIGRIIQCSLDWCRISAGGERGWIVKTALWGVTADEIID